MQMAESMALFMLFTFVDLILAAGVLMLYRAADDLENLFENLKAVGRPPRQAGERALRKRWEVYWRAARQPAQGGQLCWSLRV